ncbi:hypothetical protein, partial [Streptomyces sp. NPDC002082]|uniref:hypothetical protein n=1 Tax=Streptomyces sp. NPDC002082 TaxID=3154772 RepID=UPI003332D241
DFSLSWFGFGHFDASHSFVAGALIAGVSYWGSPARPALPERVPQTHIAEQLRAPSAPEPAARPDTETPEEVADAWADYEHGTQTVEEELRRDQS